MRQTGATLAELLVTLTIVGALASIAVPALGNLGHSSHVSAVTNELLASIHLTRSEAIKRSGRAVMCPSADGERCAASGPWSQGWIVFHDANNNARADPGEEVVLARGSVPRGIRVTSKGTTAGYIAYAADGSSRQPSGALLGGTLTICSETAARVVARDLVISLVGRARTAMVTLKRCP